MNTRTLFFALKWMVVNAAYFAAFIVIFPVAWTWTTLGIIVLGASWLSEERLKKAKPAPEWIVRMASAPIRLFRNEDDPSAKI